MATKSLVIRVEIDYALKANNCQANARHRLERGDKRLKVRNGRSWDHYCAECAVDILERELKHRRWMRYEGPGTVRALVVYRMVTDPAAGTDQWLPKMEMS